MKTTEITKPHEGSNKNEHFSDKLSVANLSPTTYYLDFVDWLRTKRCNDYLEMMYK